MIRISNIFGQKKKTVYESSKITKTLREKKLQNIRKIKFKRKINFKLVKEFRGNEWSVQISI